MDGLEFVKFLDGLDDSFPVDDWSDLLKDRFDRIVEGRGLFILVGPVHGKSSVFYKLYQEALNSREGLETPATLSLPGQWQGLSTFNNEGGSVYHDMFSEQLTRWAAEGRIVVVSSVEGVYLKQGVITGFDNYHFRLMSGVDKTSLQTTLFPKGQVTISSTSETVSDAGYSELSKKSASFRNKCDEKIRK